MLAVARSRGDRQAGAGRSRGPSTFGRSAGGAGGMGVVVILITGESVSVAGYDITVTFTTNGDLSLGVAGLEYEIGAGGVTGAADSVNMVGAAANQSVALGILDGIVPGNYWSYKPYYNMTAGDPQTTRVYGVEGVVFVSEFDGLLFGQG